MMGAEFCGHGHEQEAAILKSSAFPGLEGLDSRLSFFEEWYAFKKITRDMHVILAMDTTSMKGTIYRCAHTRHLGPKLRPGTRVLHPRWDIAKKSGTILASSRSRWPALPGAWETWTRT